MKHRPVVGILGAGQLGRMLALAGHNLAVRCLCFDSAPGPAGEVCEQTIGGFDDDAALRAFAARCDVVTYEWENVPVAAATLCAQQASARAAPPVHALAVAQDRLSEKTLFAELGVPVGRFAPARTRDELAAAAAHVGLPAVVKTRRGGYDGKGQMVVRSESDLVAAWAELGGHPGGLIVEGFVAFVRELSVLVCRRGDWLGQGGPSAGQKLERELGVGVGVGGGVGVDLGPRVRCYPLIHNVHTGGILRRSIAPAAGVSVELASRAVAYATRIVEHLDYAGVMALELFETAATASGPGEILASEIAPRVHNSGHWTTDGSVTGQFENHLRGVLGWPLGSTDTLAPAAGMVNLIGTAPTPAQVMAACDRAKVHLYAKEPRAGRKLGHVNVTAATHAELETCLVQVEALLRPA